MYLLYTGAMGTLHFKIITFHTLSQLQQLVGREKLLYLFRVIIFGFAHSVKATNPSLYSPCRRGKGKGEGGSKAGKEKIK